MSGEIQLQPLDICAKMELYKRGGCCLVKMPIVAKYVQMQSELFIYNPEEMKSLQDLVSQESKSLYEQMGIPPDQQRVGYRCLF